MKVKYDYDIIRDYLHGLVDQETARRIRDLIREDEVARSIAAGILQLEHEFNGNEAEVEKYIEALRAKQLKLINRRHIPTWTRLAAAVLVIALAGAVVWLTIGKSDPIEDELRDPYPLVTTGRGAADGDDGFEYYRKGEYKEAIDSFSPETEDVSIIFYDGLSHLYAGEYDQAAELLGTASLAESRYKEQSEWFRALSLLKAERTAEARAILETIKSNRQHYKSAAAEKVLRSF